MSRNDGMLYSGLSSPASQKVAKAKDEVTKPEPTGELVLAELARMKAEVLSIKSFDIAIDTSDEVVRRTIQRSKDRYEDLTQLERRMKRLLNVKETTHG